MASSYDLQILQAATDAAHLASLALLGRMDTCITSAAGLADGLKLLDLPVQLVRVSVTAHWPDGGSICGEGRNSPGRWAGHLIVVSNDVLLDPTASQFGPLGQHHFPPIAVSLLPGWEELGLNVDCGGHDWRLFYRRDHRQRGWKGAGMFQKTAGRREIAIAVKRAIDIQRQRLTAI